MKDSLKKLLGMFPYFFDKKEGSNFYKSQSVTNQRFQDIYQSTVDVLESMRLNKRCFIFREQEVNYYYTIHFFANYPNLKNVTCYKNDEVIYIESYSFEDNVDKFEYSYSDSVLNDFEEAWYDNATSENHRTDWRKSRNDRYFKVRYSDEATILTEDSGNTAWYISSFEAKDNTIIEFDIKLIFDYGHMFPLSFGYLGKTIPFKSYVNDGKKHRIKVVCEEGIIEFYVDDVKKTEETASSGNECKLGVLACSCEFSNFIIYAKKENPEVIPEDKFRIVVETYDEIIVEKGYPENDIIQGNIYDHDTSLDDMGEFLNVPRKEYLIVEPELYPATEPPYNNKASEDDYHYMKRMLEYALRMHTTPLPVLELWKEFGIEARMENREKLLLKVFDENRHDGLDWIPQQWEHKDKFCQYSQIEGFNFFIQYTTNIPSRNQSVGMTFLIVNAYGQSIADDSYYFDIYVDGILIKRNLNALYYSITPDNFKESEASIVHVDCKNKNGEILDDAEFEVKIRGCTDANFFVSTTGSDSNDGRTVETAFRTIGKACSSLEADNSLIAILEGNYTITGEATVNKSCLILSCDRVTITNTTDNRFFKLLHGKELQLQDLHLKHDDEVSYVRNVSYINKNSENYLSVIVTERDTPDVDIQSPLMKNLTYENNEISFEMVHIDTLTDLNGVIYDLEYTNGEIKYKVFELTGEILTPRDINNLRNSITSLTYEDYLIKYTILGDEI